MRICLYTETALPQVGGQEIVVDTLARTYQMLGHDVVLLAPQPHAPHRVRDAELPYPVVRHPRFVSARYFVSWYRYFLLRLWNRRPCDILHCHGLFPPGYLGALTRRQLGVPVVLTSHGGDLQHENVRLRKRGVEEKIIEGLKAADALVSISRFTREGYRRLCPQAKRIVDIPNGVDLDTLMSPAPRPANWDLAIVPGQYVLFLGRLRYRKGVDLLLDALTRVPKTGQVQLVVAGDGRERAALERLAADLGVAARVRFVGGVSGAYKNYLLQNALCGVIPSRISEAFGLVVLEMFAAGTPVIGTRLAGLEDLIDPGHTGWLTPPESSAALARALTEALLQPDNTRRRGAAAQQAALRFDWTAIAERHLDLYDELLARRRCYSSVSHAATRKQQTPVTASIIEAMARSPVSRGSARQR